MKVGDLVRYKMVDSIIGQPTAVVMSEIRVGASGVNSFVDILLNGKRCVVKANILEVISESR